MGPRRETKDLRKGGSWELLFNTTPIYAALFLFALFLNAVGDATMVFFPRSSTRSVQSIGRKSQAVLFTVLAAEPLSLQPRKRKRHVCIDDDLTQESDSESAEEYSCADSDIDSCNSQLEDEAEDATEEAADIEQEAPAEDVGAEEPEVAQMKEKLPAGSHVVHRDGYFTLVNYHKLGQKLDCKILILPRWAVPAPLGMGNQAKSKTLQIRTYDTDLNKPDIT